eukprot:m.121388 g.121388  ORF g.121388 m.121388 type:complete len:695 (-) comp28851_c2_seq1:70-2154(-)
MSNEDDQGNQIEAMEVLSDTEEDEEVEDIDVDEEDELLADDDYENDVEVDDVDGVEDVDVDDDAVAADEDDEYADPMTEAEVLKGRLDMFCEANSNLKFDNEDLAESLAKETSKSTDLKTQLERCQQELGMLEQDNKKNEITVKAYKTDLENRTSENKSLREEVDDHRQHLDKLNQMYDSQKEKLIRVVDEKDTQAEELTQSKDALKRLRVLLDAKTKQSNSASNDDFESTVQVVTEELRERYEKIVCSANQDLEKSYNKMGATADQKISILTQKLNEASTQVAELKEGHEVFDLELKKKTSLVSVLEQRIATLQSQLSESEETLKTERLRHQLSVAEYEQALESEKEETSQLRKRASTIQQHMHEFSDRLAQEEGKGHSGKHSQSQHSSFTSERGATRENGVTDHHTDLRVETPTIVTTNADEDHEDGTEEEIEVHQQDTDDNGVVFVNAAATVKTTQSLNDMVSPAINRKRHLDVSDDSEFLIQGKRFRVVTPSKEQTNRSAKIEQGPAPNQKMFVDCVNLDGCFVTVKNYANFEQSLNGWTLVMNKAEGGHSALTLTTEAFGSDIVLDAGMCLTIWSASGHTMCHSESGIIWEGMDFFDTSPGANYVLTTAQGQEASRAMMEQASNLNVPRGFSNNLSQASTVEVDSEERERESREERESRKLSAFEDTGVQHADPDTDGPLPEASSCTIS